MDFETKKGLLQAEYTNPAWILESGVAVDELEKYVNELENTALSKAIIKAKTFSFIANNARIAIDKDDIFQDKVLTDGIMRRQKQRWSAEAKNRYLSKELSDISKAWSCGAYKSHEDFGHISPNSKALLSLGFTGLLDRIYEAASRENLTDKQKEFYESCEIVLKAFIALAKRFADGVKPYNADNAVALENIANGKPSNIYEAMQTLVLYFFAHEYIAGARVRTLGRLDVLLYPYFVDDIKSGRYTKTEIKNMLKFFLYKFWLAKVPYDLPFCLGGGDEDDKEVTNELSYLIVETYNELNIYSPKIHIRVSDKTPKDFIKLVLACIRRGNSSFVFVNDYVGVESLRRVGIEERDAKNFVPIGCYEPAVWGVEIGCTGNGGVNLAKAIEFVFTNGVDLRTGEKIGLATGEINDYPQFVRAVKEQIAYMIKNALSYVVQVEKYYAEMYPDAILSCQYDESVKRGVDVYEGGAKYNNSSMYLYCIASVVDSVCAVKELVFESKKYTFAELGEILKKNWVGYEQDRLAALRLTHKYGNNDPIADAIAVEMSDFCAKLVNNQPNGRGGVFKAALFSIDECFKVGARTMATPDGRKAGDILSKNLCATVAMDKKGVTGLINSVTKMDLADFATGSVLDIVLHPSAVRGEDGLEAFYGILKTYFLKGGFAMHGNVFNAADLRAAQQNPEEYANLQVRVCGWNAYFVNLSKTEQDAFIAQAETNYGA